MYSQWFFSPTPTESVNSLSRQARGPQAERGNKMQVEDIFPFSLEDTWFHLNLTFLKPWANQFFFFFLIEMFFLSYGNETMYLLWNLPFFNGFCLRLTVFVLFCFFFFFFLFSNLGGDNGSTNQNSCQLFYGQGWHALCHSILKMHIVEEGPGETSSALRCFFYLIRSLLADIKCLAKN